MVSIHPVLYELERVRDSGSFATRQVVAYQAGGAILNMIASFHAPKGGTEIEAVVAPDDVPEPEALPDEPTNLLFERRSVAWRVDPEPYELAWMRARGDLGDDPALHACAFAYLSDEFPLGAALGAHPLVPDWGAGVHGEPRPRDLVPPRRARRRLVAVRAPMRRSRRRPGPRHGPDLRPVGSPRRVDRAGGALARERRGSPSMRPRARLMVISGLNL